MLTARAQSTSRESLTLDDALGQLADRFASMSSVHGGFFRVEFFVYAPVASESGEEWQGFFRRQLESHHFTVTEDPVAPLLRIGVAETPTELVFSAATRIGERDEVRLLAFPRANFRAADLAVAPVRLEKQLVYQSADLLLDASFSSDRTVAEMIVLAEHNGQLTVVHIDPLGSAQQSTALNGVGSMLSRDPVGQLAWQGDLVTVFLPGKSCQFTWPVSVEPKCQAAKIAPRPPVVLTPSCGGAWKLTADGADWTAPELLQAVPANSLQKGSAAILSDFPGPIVSINGEQNPSATALVVTRNLRTGIYELYKVTLACGN